MTDRLRALWDFDDLDASEERFRAALGRETSDRGRSEVLTQLARVEGLRGRFEEGDRLLDQAETLAGGGTALSRLERGRLRRSSGDRAAAMPLFEAAFAAALESGDEFLAGDAAHMAALVAPDPDTMAAWTQRGLDVAGASDDPYWLGPLLNNLGWAQYESGDYDEALATFSQALAARERDTARPYEIEIARYAVAKALLALGRPAEAAELLERAVTWADAAGVRDRWFDEALAESHAALGRGDPAKP